MNLVIQTNDYGTQRYFVFYIMDNGVCLSATWSKQFTSKDELEG